MDPFKLKPCPFCGSLDLEVDHLGDEERPFFVVSCSTCEAEGPISRTELRARQAWNTRRRRKHDGNGE
jgi:Lar family restriction alleviation protein